MNASATMTLIVIRQRPAAYPALAARTSARRWHGRHNLMIVRGVFTEDPTLRAAAFRSHRWHPVASTTQVYDSPAHILELPRFRGRLVVLVPNSPLLDVHRSYQ